MKLFHLSDLHLGKRVNGFSMLEDQQYILRQILTLVDAEQPDGILLAGDVYDKTVPGTEAVSLFDDFLCALAARHLPVFVISGNHDSPERLCFGGRLLDASGVYLSPVYSGHVAPIRLTDAYGPVDFYLLPFVKPIHVRRFFPDAGIESYTDALRTAVQDMHPDPAVRNVLVTHQFVTGAARSDSEELSVGGTDNVDLSVFDGFDYVALGHIHGPQNLAENRVRYCGTPLKYSFSEARHHKSVTVVELAEKGSVTLRTLPLTPLHDLREITGSFARVTDKAFWADTAVEDYLHVTLTDEEDVPDGMAKLRKIYPNVMKLDYDNTRTRTQAQLQAPEAVQQADPRTLFAQFYEQQNNQTLSDDQRALIDTLVAAIWEKEDV